jgi:peptidyl-prolyl cis-trans isomerase C
MPKTEYRARHVLVQTEDFAKAVIARINKGERFEDAAKRDSLDGSKERGGDLGWFTPQTMVKPFADAVMALKKGEMTQAPVQSQFGWHVIKLEDTRDVQPPPFDQVKDQLNNVVLAKKFKTYADELKKTAKIENKL